MRTHRRLIGFSLIELVVVMGIIALLVGILLPAISRIRESGRSTVCLANLQQWGYVYQIYLSANHGKSIPEWEAPVFRTPWEALEPYGKSNSISLRCPSASEPKSWTLKPPDSAGLSGASGSASHAWIWKDSSGMSVGSYGFNLALFNVTRPVDQPIYFHFPVKDAARIPVFADCIDQVILPGGNVSPTDFENPNLNGGISECCLDRHRMAVNVALLDGHAEHVTLNAMFNFRWSATYVPHGVVIPGT